MELTNFKENEILFLNPVGRIDTTTSGDFQSKSLALIQNETKVALDFSKVNYISSAGLRAILVLAKELNKSNGKFLIFEMNSSIKDIFDMAGFSSIIKIVAGKDDAIDEISK